MIITSIPNGLIETIEASGHYLYFYNGVAVASDETAVQTIIDNYDPLPLAKKEAKQRLIDQFRF